MQPTSDEIPEDVKAEMDLEARRLGVTPTPALADDVPEDVRAEIDHAARLAQADVASTPTPDGPPVVPGDEPEPSA